MKFVRDMKIGWNLGNTFDAITNAQKEDDLSIEWSWCGEKTTKEMIDAVKAAGFKTLRLPVSWHNHVSGDHYTHGLTGCRKCWIMRLMMTCM